MHIQYIVKCTLHTHTHKLQSIEEYILFVDNNRHLYANNALSICIIIVKQMVEFMDFQSTTLAQQFYYKLNVAVSVSRCHRSRCRSSTKAGQFNS